MSQKFHQFYQNSVIRSQLKEQVRPILLNNWEATYFDFDKNIIYELADEAKKIGIELFVLDDGWFGTRDDDQSSLGDWFPNEKKLGGTLNSFINGIKNKGLDFGIWLEPEMISKNSLLYEKHPEWAIHIPERIPQQVRHQYVLDLSRNDVQEYLINQIDNLLSNHEIDYVKWDMNRNITDAFSSELKNKNQQEFNHRYILGLYKILEVITAKHPNVLFESCAGGGGRYDAGMLFYMPQTWTSDDTDAIARLSIQRGTTFIYPPVTMGCHVSATPNHQVGRITSLNTRALVAQQGNFGYELNLLELSDVEKIELAQQILTYKKERETLQFGVHSRLKVNNPDNEEAWQKYNQKTGELIVTHVTILAQPNTVPKRLKLVNLNKNQKYEVNSVIRQGDELMKIGLIIPKAKEDFFATKWVISKWEG